MKSALEIVAFSNVGRLRGILDLMDVTLAALDAEDQPLAAAFLDHAREDYLSAISRPKLTSWAQENLQ